MSNKAPYIAMGLVPPSSEPMLSSSSESDDETVIDTAQKKDTRVPFYPDSQRRNRGSSRLAHENKSDRKKKEGFRWPEFIRSVIYHVIGIPAIPLILILDGRKHAVNCDFFPRKGKMRGFILQNFFFALYLGVNISYFALSPKYVTLLDIIVMDALVMIRALTISVKYAVIPSRTLELMRTKILNPDEIGHTLLLGAWSSGSPELIQEEIENAERLLNLKLSSISFLYNPHEMSYDRVMNALISKCSCVKPPDSGGKFLQREGYVGSIPAHAVCHQMVEDAYKDSPMKTRNAVIVVIFRAVLTLLLPYLVNGEDSVFYDTTSLVIFLCLLPVVYLYYLLDLLYLIVTLHDFRRRKFVMEQMYFILTGAGYLPRKKERGSLSIDLRIPDNIVAWLNLRHVLRSYGRRWKQREEVFIGIFFSFLVGLIVYIIILYFWAGREYINPLDMLIVAFDTVVFCVVFVRVLMEASVNNSLFVRHRKVLSAAEGTCRYEKWLMDSPFIENGECEKKVQCLGTKCDLGRQRTVEQNRSRAIRLTNSASLLKSAQSVIECDDLSHPVTVLGVPPSMNLARTLVGLTATALFAALQRLTGLRK